MPIPQEAKQHFDQVVQYEMQEMDRQLAVAMTSLASELTRKGMFQSGAHISSRADIATSSLKARAHYILGQLIRCLTAHGASLDADNTKEALDLLKDTIERQLQSLLSRAFQGPGMQTPDMEQARQQAMQTFGREGARLISRMTTEMSLSASASKSRSEPAGTVWNIAGPVGIIQTGNGNRASVQQHFDRGAKTEVAAVLESILQQLKADEGRSIGNHEELRELVADTKAELEKPTGNGLKIVSGLRGIADTTKFVGSLAPAYGVLKPLLSQFGIHLP